MPIRLFKNEKYAKEVGVIQNRLEAKENESTTEIVIYGDIGESWWGDATSAKDIDRILNTVSTDHITVRINSPGGSAFDGVAIYNRLVDHPAKVKVIVDGWACSAASIIAMAGDEIIMNSGAMMMIHRASTFTYGNAEELQKDAELLEKLDKSLLDIYMNKVKISREELNVLLTNETWFTAEEAELIGLATQVEEKDEQTADPEAFKNNLLARFQQKPAASASQNSILNKFKRTDEQ